MSNFFTSFLDPVCSFAVKRPENFDENSALYFSTCSFVTSSVLYHEFLIFAVKMVLKPHHCASQSEFGNEGQACCPSKIRKKK